MDTLPLAPGIKTLWVIQLKEGKTDFLIPSPFNRQEWLHTNTQTHNQALELLHQINQACNDLKNVCNPEKLQSIKDFLQKAPRIFGHIDDLDALLKNYDELMNRYTENPPDERHTDEEE